MKHAQKRSHLARQTVFYYPCHKHSLELVNTKPPWVCSGASLVGGCRSGLDKIMNQNAKCYRSMYQSGFRLCGDCFNDDSRRTISDVDFVTIQSFRKFDENGTGLMDILEFYQFCKWVGLFKNQKEMDWKFDQVDSNNNKSIDLEEFRLVIKSDQRFVQTLLRKSFERAEADEQSSIGPDLGVSGVQFIEALGQKIESDELTEVFRLFAQNR